MNIKPLFAVPVGYTYDFIKERERLELYKSIKSLTHIPHNAIKGNGNSTHGLDVNFLPKKIKNRVQDAVDEYTKELKGSHYIEKNRYNKYIEWHV